MLTKSSIFCVLRLLLALYVAVWDTASEAIMVFTSPYDRDHKNKRDRQRAARLKQKQDHLSSVKPFLKEAEMFSVLDDSELTSVAEHSKFHRVGKKQIVFEENANPAGGFLVARGRLFLHKQASGRKQVVTELLGHGDPFGVVCAAKAEPYPLSATTLCESVILCVEQEFLVSLTTQNSKFAIHLFDLCRARFQAAQQKYAQLAHADSKTRVASALLLFAEKFSDTASTTIEVTREELSRIAGVTIETCIRVTKRLEENGLLAFPGNKQILLLDKTALAALSSS